MLGFSSAVSAQELFPTTEPASSIPKGAIGVRVYAEDFKEIAQSRNQFSLRLMYGITAKWSISLQPNVSNHHDVFLPATLLTHTHPGNSTLPTAGKVQYGLSYPYLFGGFYFYSKCRLFSFDGNDSHFRIALYGEYSTSKVAHDEAEPNLVGDNGGYGGGFIVTRLKGRLAVSFTGGVIIPDSYAESRTMPHFGSYIFTNTIEYGRAVKYDLSIGYLLYPSQYESYNQANYNIYLELIGRSYEGAKITQNGEVAEIASPALMAGNYIEARPGIQKIFNSNTRLDLSIGFDLSNRSWIHFTPLYTVGLQHYFYLAKRSRESKADSK